jgi:hypothetical protein
MSRLYFANQSIHACIIHKKEGYYRRSVEKKLTGNLCPDGGGIFFRTEM